MRDALRPRVVLRRLLCALAIAVLGTSGCGVWRPVPVPIASLAEPARCDAPADTLLVLWRWLKDVPAQGSGARLPLYLGYGLEDRFLADDELLAATLPAARVFTAPGGHDWSVWLGVWQRMLEAMPLRRDASCAGREASKP